MSMPASRAAWRSCSSNCVRSCSPSRRASSCILATTGSAADRIASAMSAWISTPIHQRSRSGSSPSSLARSPLTAGNRPPAGTGTEGGTFVPRGPVAPWRYPPGVDDRYEVAYREAVRSVDDQIRTVDNIRGRAATLFSAAGVAVAVLGLVVRDAGGSPGGCALGVGVAGFVVLAAATVAIWWPTKRGQFLMDAGKIIRDSIETDENP